MKKKNSSGSGIFLMEMIVVVCFFVICASVCILAFAKADRLSRLASDRNQAVLAAQSVAEVWKLEGAEGLADRLSAGNISDDRQGSEWYRVIWDRDWNAKSASLKGDTADSRGALESWPEQAAFRVDVKVTRDDSGMRKAEIVISRVSDSEELFSLETVRYERP